MKDKVKFDEWYTCKDGNMPEDYGLLNIKVLVTWKHNIEALNYSTTYTCRCLAKDEDVTWDSLNATLHNPTAWKLPLPYYWEDIKLLMDLGIINKTKKKDFYEGKVL